MRSAIRQFLNAPRVDRFRRDNAGIAAIEFALILPIMIVLYLGGFEVSEAVIINRKVTHATSVLGDLVTQQEAITAAEMTNILNAVTAVMTPYPATAVRIVISGVTISSAGVAKVTWSKGRNTAALAVNTTVTTTLPVALRQNSTFIVMAKVSYTYTAPFGHTLVGDIALEELFFLRPRYSSTITCVCT